MLASQRSRGKASMIQLPVDALLAIFRHLDVGDVLRMRQTCTTLLELTTLRNVWHTLLRVHVQEQNIPIPGLAQRPIDSLTAQELETYTLRALKLCRNWRSETPAHIQRLEITSGPQSRVVAIQFLPGRGGRWLLSLASIPDEANRGSFILQCWDLKSSPPTCFAQRQLYQFRGFCVNTDPSSPAILAVQAPNISTLTIDFTGDDPVSNFHTLATFPSHAHGLYFLSGSTLLTRGDEGRLRLWDVGRLESLIELYNPDNYQTGKYAEAILSEKFAVVVRATMLEIYALPFPRGGVSTVQLHPIVQHRWPWRIDSVVISPQASWADTHSRRLSPINILVRFGSLFPWPINLLHHYVLVPSASYQPAQETNLSNLPYQIPPRLMQTIGSPIRLFATSPMALGAYGTAVWIDSHTEDYFGHGDHGQRLAGRFLPVEQADSDNDDVHLSGQIASVAASTVFSVREVDGWAGVAVDEQEGRVAVGAINGQILVFEYA